MEFIIPQHDQDALSLWAADPEKLRAESADRMARLEALDPERLPMALMFLSGYHPRVLDAILDAVEPCGTPGCAGETPGQELFCLKCDAPVGVFPAHGKDYMHYRGVVTATSKPKPYKADHKPVIGWRPATNAPAMAR
jgi:hypothetical protein